MLSTPQYMSANIQKEQVYHHIKFSLCPLRKTQNNSTIYTTDYRVCNDYSNFATGKLNLMCHPYMMELE